jgi:hypothetical protein
VKLGMISEKAANSDSNERILLYDLWSMLDGNTREEISIDNLKVAIMAILKFEDKKRIGVITEGD